VANLPTFAIYIQNRGGEIMSLSLKGDMFPMTHGDGLTILDEHFGQSAIGSGPANNVEGFNKWLICAAESNTPGVLATPQHPPISSINAVSSEASDILEPDQTASAAMSESSSNIGSSDSRSLSTNPMSYLPSETHYINKDFRSGVLYAPYVQRPILDKSAQWLEYVLMPL
jgi:hypothetical protein